MAWKLRSATANVAVRSGLGAAPMGPTGTSTTGAVAVAGSVLVPATDGVTFWSRVLAPPRNGRTPSTSAPGTVMLQRSVATVIVSPDSTDGTVPSTLNVIGTTSPVRSTVHEVSAKVAFPVTDAEGAIVTSTVTVLVTPAALVAVKVNESVVAAVSVLE